MVRGGKVFAFDNDVHCDAKNLLKSLAFFEKFEIISPFTYWRCIEGIFLMLSPFTYRGCIEGIFLMLKK